jgi:hypothetical protein
VVAKTEKDGQLVENISSQLAARPFASYKPKREQKIVAL